jgi:hypothetical protein
MPANREEAIAYGFIAITVFLIGAGLLYVFMQPLINPLTQTMNSQIDAGHISIQTANAYSWNEQMFRWGIPIAMLVGMILFAVVRALYRRKMEGYG